MTQTAHQLLDFIVPSGSKAPSQARDALHTLEGELKPDILHTLKLLVSELVSNSVRHAYLEPGDRILVSVWQTERAVGVQVTDPGRHSWFEDSDAFLSSVGYGLSLCDRLADRGGAYRDNGSHVWFEIDLTD